VQLEENGYYELPNGKIAAVVTYLEMTSPPPRSSAPDPAGLELVSFDRHDLAGYRDLFRRIGQDWLWFSRLLLEDKALAAILHDPAVELLTLRRDGRTIGLLELDYREPGEVELAFLGLIPEAVGHGAGRWAINQAIGRAFARQPRRFWVHTCTLDHPGALRFYQAAGFRAYKRAVEVADDPRLAGVLPLEAASGVPVLTPSLESAIPRDCQAE
jgi:GNAT superfamily N-acetyltransferase